MPTALATHACHQSPYLQPVPAATKPAILIVMPFSLWHRNPMPVANRHIFGQYRQCLSQLFLLWRHSHYYPTIW